MPPAVEERALTLRLAHPVWGPDRILFQLGREHERGAAGRGRAVSVGGLPVSGSAPADRGAARKRRRGDYKRWERSRPMALWQMDVMGGVFLADGTELKVVTGIDDHSRYLVCARLVARGGSLPPSRT